MPTNLHGDSTLVAEGLNVTIKHTQCRGNGKKDELAVAIAYGDTTEKQTAERLLQTVQEKLGDKTHTLSTANANGQLTLALQIPSQYMHPNLVMGDIEKILGVERSFVNELSYMATMGSQAPADPKAERYVGTYNIGPSLVAVKQVGTTLHLSFDNMDGEYAEESVIPEKDEIAKKAIAAIVSEFQHHKMDFLTGKKRHLATVSEATQNNKSGCLEITITPQKPNESEAVKHDLLMLFHKRHAKPYDTHFTEPLTTSKQATL